MSDSPSSAKAPRTPAAAARACRPLSDYALIGNTHSAALVASDGSIDWCCLPHFDSGAVFCRLLDRERGGFFQVSPVARYRSAQRYRSGGVLETEFETEGGRIRLTDLMHTPRLRDSRIGAEDRRCHRLLRCVEGLAGEVEVRIVMKPTFDFAQAVSALRLTEDGALAESGGERLLLRGAPQGDLRLADGAVHASLRLRAGRRCWLVLAYAAADEAGDALAPDDPETLLAETERHWTEWEQHSRYEGPHAALVRQSARALKMLTFGPTGALVAAPTTSLPEEIGGVRNWDYRYCWLRDASLVLSALMALGHPGSAFDFFQWLEDLCEGECEHVQIMYRLDGHPDLPERELGGLAGYQDSRPVRIGNAAASQRQLDVYGHVLDAAWYYVERMRRPVRPRFARMLAFLADQAAARWRQPDHSLWEVRGPPQQFVSSKLWCWVALDRAVRLARAGSIEGDAATWARERDAVRHAIETRGVDPQTGAFVRSFGARCFDASVLMMPRVGFVAADDPRMRATVDAVQRHLTSHGLVYRYLSEDGLPGNEGTFAMCSFWLVDNLAWQGRLDEAHALFEHVVSFGSGLGLFAEQIDPVNRRLLGNYPQGFTHLALLRSAQTLGEAGRRARAAA